MKMSLLPFPSPPQFMKHIQTILFGGFTLLTVSGLFTCKQIDTVALDCLGRVSSTGGYAGRKPPFPQTNYKQPFLSHH